VSTFTADGHEVPKDQIAITIMSSADRVELTEQELADLGRLVVTATRERREWLERHGDS